MHVEVFEDSPSGTAYAAFQAWRERRPEGYFLNRRSRDYMLHTANCPHFDPTIEKMATKFRKVCASTQAELKEWSEIEGLQVSHCSDCCR